MGTVFGEQVWCTNAGKPSGWKPMGYCGYVLAFAIALLMVLGGVLSACGFSNTFNYGHGQGQCENCGGY